MGNRQTVDISHCLSVTHEIQYQQSYVYISTYCFACSVMSELCC